MDKSLGLYIQEYLVNWGVSAENALVLKIFIVLLLILLLAFLANFITRRILLAYIKRLIRKSQNQWDDLLIEKGVLRRLANFAPVLVFYFTIPQAFINIPKLASAVQKGLEVVMLLLGIFVVDSVINLLHGAYQRIPMSREKSIKGYIQVVKILIYFIGFILILSLLLGESPLVFLGGLSAMAAVLMFVFKDTILGFVAGIQLSANNMVRIGDWIEMPGRNADGTVIEITLNTVKVQNWDKTISQFPTYALVSESFINWRGMEESEGRRIKRSVYIDLKSIKFCTPEMLEKFRKVQILREYIDKKEEELKVYNETHGIDNSILVNGRRQTNLGVFRHYVSAYLKRHPRIHNEMTFLVRHLQPTERGIPIEIFVFSREKSWPVYESIQADIFDHILAVIPEFGLRVFQNPTGDDFRMIGVKDAASQPQKE
jgi:miniconductance mechanosensitive channel